jgi:TRAP-type mannitol/chloroaromatic compound transport system substrate-binding protein
LDLFVNSKAYEALSAENKSILEAASTVAHVNIQARYDSHNPAALKQLVGTGTKLKAFPKDVMNFAFKEAMGLYEEIASKNENWKKVYTEWLKFRAEQHLWFRFTEAGFDRFMQDQKL